MKFKDDKLYKFVYYNDYYNKKNEIFINYKPKTYFE